MFHKYGRVAHRVLIVETEIKIPRGVCNERCEAKPWYVQREHVVDLKLTFFSVATNWAPLYILSKRLAPRAQSMGRLSTQSTLLFNVRRKVSTEIDSRLRNNIETKSAPERVAVSLGSTFFVLFRFVVYMVLVHVQNTFSRRTYVLQTCKFDKKKPANTARTRQWAFMLYPMKDSLSLN